ncbi:MAG: S24 family peptidase [Acidimicrobiia bacterium]
MDRGESKLRRFRVVEESMLPSLQPGDLLLARRDPSPQPGSIVVVPHPRIDGMWIVKRLAAVSGGEAWLESDNTAATLADSRTLGWVPTDGLHRAVVRYRRPFSLARL